ncbi:MAG: hypothetical protein E7411_05280 [Ruminococcaceae bacterium]|nr:hypothetical protein [Oscillospiraceae bacterium]
MRKIIAFVILFVLAFSCMNVFAAPETINPADAVSNVSGILTVTNPSTQSISSYDRSHNISGYAAAGAEISIYSLNNGVYTLLHKNEAPVSFICGASGMFISPISLQYGRNDILVRAQIDGKVQYAAKTITVLSPNLFNLFRGFKLFS